MNVLGREASEFFSLTCQQQICHQPCSHFVFGIIRDLLRRRMLYYFAQIYVDVFFSLHSYKERGDIPLVRFVFLGIMNE